MFITVKRGSRTSNSKIYISRKAKTINFSAGFLRENKINLQIVKYVRLALDNTTGEMAVEFSQNKKEDESLTLTNTQSKTAASCSVNAILNTFAMGIGEIAGIYTYKNKAIDGPLKIAGFSDNGFILRPKNREV